MTASIETALVIHDRGSATVKDIRREVRGLDDDAKSASLSLDAMAGLRSGYETNALATERWSAAINDVSGKVSTLDPKMVRHEALLRKTATTTARLATSTERLVLALRDLGSVDARPHVEIDGIAQARVELAAFRAELESLGRT